MSFNREVVENCGTFIQGNTGQQKREQDVAKCSNLKGSGGHKDE